MPLLCSCISDSECSGDRAIYQAGDKFTAGLGCSVEIFLMHAEGGMSGPKVLCGGDDWTKEFGCDLYGLHGSISANTKRNHLNC